MNKYIDMQSLFLIFNLFMVHLYHIYKTDMIFKLGLRSIQRVRFITGSDILILKKSLNIFFSSCNLIFILFYF